MNMMRGLARWIRPFVVGRRREFERIFRANAWRDPETRSGHASTLFQTRVIRREIPLLIRELGVRTLLDIPCGDLNWISQTDLGVDHYIGADIVGDLIELNQTHRSTPNRTFMTLDLVQDPLPKADMILCRDCFIHLTNRDILKALRNIKQSEATYLLTTTFTGDRENRDIPTGEWRPINLQLPPYDLPAPLRVINEGFHDEKKRYTDRSLGLWLIGEL